MITRHMIIRQPGSQHVTRFHYLCISPKLFSSFRDKNHGKAILVCRHSTFLACNLRNLTRFFLSNISNTSWFSCSDFSIQRNEFKNEAKPSFLNEFRGILKPEEEHLTSV